MTTADEIRARVKAADEARIESRADRAAAVAEAHGRRAVARATLDQLDTDLTAAVRAAAEVMTLDELVDFAGVPRSDLAHKAPLPAASVKARSPKSRRRPAAKVPASEAATEATA